MTAQKEFRWEYKEIGQGHYYLDAQECIDAALEASSTAPDLTVQIERFKPTRFLIATLEPTDVLYIKVLDKIQSTLERIRLLTEEEKIKDLAPPDLLQHLHSLLAIEIKMALT